MKCDLCGTPIVAVGNVTMHYERKPIDWELFWADLTTACFQSNVALMPSGQAMATYRQHTQTLIEKQLVGQ